MKISYSWLERKWNDMNRKLKRLIEDEERTMEKIEELQFHLKDVRAARKQEEDLEIVRSIRTMKLGARELFNLLTGIQDGSVSMESLPIPEDEDDETEDAGAKPDISDAEDNQTMTGAGEAPESEENHE